MNTSQLSTKYESASSIHRKILKNLAGILKGDTLLVMVSQ